MEVRVTFRKEGGEQVVEMRVNYHAKSSSDVEVGIFAGEEFATVDELGKNVAERGMPKDLEQEFKWAGKRPLVLTFLASADKRTSRSGALEAAP